MIPQHGKCYRSNANDTIILNAANDIILLTTANDIANTVFDVAGKYIFDIASNANDIRNMDGDIPSFIQP